MQDSLERSGTDVSAVALQPVTSWDNGSRQAIKISAVAFTSHLITLTTTPPKGATSTF